MRYCIVKIIFILFLACTNVSGASFPSSGYDVEPQELQVPVVAEDNNMLGVQYNYANPAEVVSAGTYGTHPVFTNTGSGFNATTDSIRLGGDVWDLIHSGIWGYLVIDTDGDGVLDPGEDPSLGAVVELYVLPLTDNVYMILSLALFYILFVIIRKKKIDLLS